MTRELSGHWKTFFCALGIGALIFLPFVLIDEGIFLYYGDYNVQQIPFYKLAHEAVRSGDVLWSWYTDLGANFIGSYSFYLLFSPFFWLTLPFPTAWVPYLMAPLLVLKTACSALTAHLYLRRFVRDQGWAVVGSLLYAFSGWMTFNIFFNHFHEVAVFFPLLLLGVEMLVYENKKGFFAAMVALNAMVNYWFFVGEVVFVILYVIVRSFSPGWRMTLRRFVRLALESVLGVLCAAAVLVPSVLALLGNPRTGTGELLSGWNFWLYWHEQMYPAITHSILFPPDLPARPNFFPDRGAKWSSMSGWLPLFGATGTLAYFFARKKDWLKRILALSLLFALVPGLNSMFILLNHSYYARWFYMPVLLMALATVRALEDSEGETAHFRRSIKWVFGLSVVFILICGLGPRVEEGVLKFGLSGYPGLMWATSVIALTCLLLSAVLVLWLCGHPRFRQLCGAGVALVAVVFSIFYMSNGKNNSERSNFLRNSALGGREAIHLPDEGFARTDVYDGLDNLAMFWHRPNIQAFHSIVPPSIMEFYPAVGVTRDVGSRPEAEYYALRPLLSVRWLFIEQAKEEQSPMPGYSFHSQQLVFNVYENENYLPMGFGYYDYADRAQLDMINEKLRANLMLRAVVLEEDAAARNGDILTRLDLEQPIDLTYDDMVNDVYDRLEQTAYSFETDRTGFTARSNLDRETLLFFSVPYERGWTASVNGGRAVIEKANIGFMAVRVPAGEAVIRFDYFTPGLIEGAAISGGALLLLLLYGLVGRRRGRKQEAQALDVQRALFLGRPVSMTWEEFLHAYRDRQARAARLQQALNEAAAVFIHDELDEEERTLNFYPDPPGDGEQEQSTPGPDKPD